jgi:hypothetical protein
VSVYGPLQIGRLILTEDWQASEDTSQSARVLKLKGQEASVVGSTIDVIDGGTP